MRCKIAVCLSDQGGFGSFARSIAAGGAGSPRPLRLRNLTPTPRWSPVSRSLGLEGIRPSKSLARLLLRFVSNLRGIVRSIKRAKKMQIAD